MLTNLEKSHLLTRLVDTSHSIKTDKVKFEIKHMLGAKGDAIY